MSSLSTNSIHGYSRSHNKSILGIQRLQVNFWAACLTGTGNCIYRNAFTCFNVDIECKESVRVCISRLGIRF